MQETTDPKQKKYYEVMLPTIKRPAYFAAQSLTDEFLPGERVIVETTRGQELGVVSNLPPKLTETPPLNIDSVTAAANRNAAHIILRRANAEDSVLAKQRELQALEALKTVKEKVHELDLQMKILAAFIPLSGNYMVIKYYAQKRVDFRILVKELSSKLKMRIEMNQIGPRDRAILTKGQGICGCSLCCSVWLQDLSSISIKMAKSQGMSLNPGRAAGVCGRLMCCLKFEQDDESENLLYDGDYGFSGRCGRCRTADRETTSEGEDIDE